MVGWVYIGAVEGVVVVMILVAAAWGGWRTSLWMSVCLSLGD